MNLSLQYTRCIYTTVWAPEPSIHWLLDNFLFRVGVSVAYYITALYCTKISLEIQLPLVFGPEGQISDNPFIISKFLLSFGHMS